MWRDALNEPTITTVVRMLFGLWLFVTGGAAFAENYPVRPIKLIVPYPAGGGTDIAARWIGQKLSEALHQQIVVDNRAGANGNLGTNVMAKGPPDGSRRSNQISVRCGSSSDAFFWVASRMKVSDRITCSSARIDFLRPTKRGAIMCGNTTMSRSGNTG